MFLSDRYSLLLDSFYLLEMLDSARIFASQNRRIYHINIFS
ncbi:hypothetical protein HMPREF9141_0388 [Prevotella multiformis DSM 16608]|uniref:Uncharacterized protein n=1 Tax=Prevotella multiformis DSM 16608 TaxID=888743 RepID=F0F472_9BACT|nr:hypothetical protein HMPREF9141_0388 [Prevotella multiformis DSM 16608]